jgi:hypothetical protein
MKPLGVGCPFTSEAIRRTVVWSFTNLQEKSLATAIAVILQRVLNYKKRSHCSASTWRSIAVSLLLFACSGCPGGGSDSAGTSPSSVSQTVTSAGGTLTLPGVAVMTVPPGAVATATFELAQVSMPLFDSTAKETAPDHTLLNAPRIRIKVSTPFETALFLKVTVPDLQTQVPNTHQAVAVALIQQQGSQGESIDSLLPLGGESCGNSDAICVVLRPGKFLCA